MIISDVVNIHIRWYYNMVYLVNVLIDYHHESDESSFICSIGHDSAGTIIGSGAANPGKKVEDDGVPAMANHSPEEPEEKGGETMGKSWNIMKNNSWV